MEYHPGQIGTNLFWWIVVYHEYQYRREIIVSWLRKNFLISPLWLLLLPSSFPLESHKTWLLLIENFMILTMKSFKTFLKFYVSIKSSRKGKIYFSLFLKLDTKKTWIIPLRIFHFQDHRINPRFQRSIGYDTFVPQRIEWHRMLTQYLWTSKWSFYHEIIW